VAPHDIDTNGEPEPTALFRRVERLKDALLDLGGDAYTRITDRDPGLTLALRRLEGEHAPLWHRVDRVDEEVTQNASQLTGVAEYHRGMAELRLNAIRDSL